MATLAMKFGGTALGTTAALTQVLSIVLHEATQWDHLILVVSALEGVTDALIEAAQLAQLSNRRGYRRIAATIRTRHLALVEKLPLGPVERATLHADIDRLLFDLLNISQTISDAMSDTVTAETMDAVIGVGEKLAARVVAALLRQNDQRGVAIDTTDIIITDDTFGAAVPNWELTRERVNQHLLPMLARDIIPVMTGFIGATRTGKPTTLGRGGSDLSASILSACTGVKELWVWSDVDGIMSADPDEVRGARVIPELSYDEMGELAYFGARVLHAHMVEPLRANNIPLRVKNVYKPQQTGTLIHARPQADPMFKAVTSIPGIGLSASRSGSVDQLLKVVNEVMSDTIGSGAEVMIGNQGASSSFLCFVIPTLVRPDAVYNVQNALEARLTHHPALQNWKPQPVSIVSVIGEVFRSNPSLIGQTLQALDSLRIVAIAQNPAGCGFSVVLEPQDAEHALRQIHALIA